MKYLILILFIFISTVKIPSQWFPQSSGTTNTLNNIFFIDANTGTAIGLSGTVRKTTNGGVNWFSQQIIPENLFGIYYINANTGFIGGDNLLSKTTNGGTNWITLPSPAGLYRGVYFLDANTGFACGGSGLVAKTINGGANWVSLTSGTTQFLSNVKFSDAQTGYITGYNGIVLKTTDAGANWSQLNTGLTELLFGLAVITNDIVYVSGEGGKIIKTIDGGANWVNQVSTITGRINNLFFLNANTGTGAAHNNFIIRTTNGGLNWIQQPSGLTGQNFNGVSFTSIQQGFISGSNGNIIHTTTGGFPIPAAPNLLLPVNGATNVSLTALLDWDSVAFGKTYQVQISLDTVYSSTVLDSSLIILSSLNIPPGSLNNNVRYFWHVRCENAGGIGPWSVNYSFTTIVALPFAPGLIAPVNGASNVSLTPTFDWDSTSPADSYTLQASLDTSFSNPYIFISGITQSFLNLTNPPLQNNFRYYWRVNATNPAGTGPWSTVFNFTTLLGMPAAPVLLSPPNFATGVSLTPLLDWVEDISATNYRVQLSQDSAFASTLFDTNGFNISQVNVPGGLLTNVTTYFWRVRTTNPIGTGPYSQPFRFTTLLSPPIAPVLVYPPNNSTDISTTPTLNWDSVQYSTSYRVQLSTDSTFTTTLLINAGGLVFSHYNVPGGLLSNNTLYYWRVNATNSAGTGPYSIVWKFRTVISPPVAAPSLISPPNGAVNQPLTPTLDWNDVFGTTGYKLLVSTDSLFNTTLLDTTITPSQFTIPAGRLSGSQTYYWKCRGFNIGGFGPWSVTWRFSTLVIGIEPISEIIPDKFMLYDNFPNPFNPVTNIKFDIPKHGIGIYQNAELIIYDITGRIVSVLINENLRPGKYSVQWNAGNYSSGIYIYSLRAGNFSAVKKMVLIK